MKKLQVKFGETYNSPMGLVRFYPICETEKAIGVIRIHKWEKLPEKIASFVYQTKGGTRLIELGLSDGEGFLMQPDQPIIWLPKSQVRLEGNQLTIFADWLVKKYNFNELKEV